MNLKEIRLEAEKLRRQFSRENKSINPFPIVSRLGIKIINYDFPMEIMGLLVFLKDKAYIGINQRLTLPWKRFTLAHELGHYTLHQARFYLCGLPGSSQQEKEASYFASELLLPTELLYQETEFRENNYQAVAYKYRVPVEIVRERTQK